jgi:hypothetical protein
MPPRKVVLDTNFFLLPAQFNIDIFGGLLRVIEEPHQYVISSRMLTELEQLAENHGKTGAEAKLGLKIYDLHKDKIEVVASGMPVDSWIKKYAVENRAYVCTNDKELKNRLAKNGIRVIARRGKNQVGFV